MRPCRQAWSQGEPQSPFLERKTDPDHGDQVMQPAGQMRSWRGRDYLRGKAAEIIAHFDAQQYPRPDGVLDTTTERGHRDPLAGLGEEREAAERLVRRFGADATEDTQTTAGRGKGLDPGARPAGVKQNVVVHRMRKAPECRRPTPGRDPQVAHVVGIMQLSAHARIKVLSEHYAKCQAVVKTRASGSGCVRDSQGVSETAAGQAPNHPLFEPSRRAQQEPARSICIDE